MAKVESWSQNQKIKLIRIALENTQVKYILKDKDVNDFYSVVCGEIDNEEANKIKEILNSEKE